MHTHPRHLSIPAFAIALLLGTVSLHAGAGGIQDTGAFFSEFAKAKAMSTINEVASTLRKDIVVETFATVPDDMKSAVSAAASSTHFSATLVTLMHASLSCRGGCRERTPVACAVLRQPSSENVMRRASIRA